MTADKNKQHVVGEEPTSDNNLREDAREVSGTTTHDLRHEAQEAIKLYSTSRDEPQVNIFKPGMLLRVEIKGSEITPITIEPEAETVIGRRDPTSNIMPEVDLTHHAGYQLGLSRRHALIRRHEDTLELVDLGSRNGTYLNGVKMEPDTPHVLCHGDEVQLGKIVLKIVFVKSEN